MAQHIALLQSRIYTALQGRMHRREQPSNSFICDEGIYAVWTNPETRLLWELGHLLQWTIEDIRIVHSRLLKILSLLVWINFKDWPAFNSFYLAGRRVITDDDLPIMDPGHLIECFPHDPAFRDQFVEKQYIFLPIKVAEDDDGVNEQSRWSEQHRLPSIVSLPMGSGTSGIVTKELIAARHIRQVGGHENSREEWWACKRIRGTGEPDSVVFETETKNQRQFKLSLTSNRNIMLSFATILRGPDLFIFSKLADCNLFELLTGKCDDFSQYCLTVTPLAIVQESYCLVGALKFLHHGLDTSSGKMFCAHMDLKPENVLVTWRQRRPGQLPVGLWQIADFGISKIKRPRRPATMYLEPMPLGNMAAQVAGLEMTPTAAVRGSGAFQAPEVGGNTARAVGQESDMWSFGCIFATVLAFASGGPAEVGKLYVARDHGDQDYFYDTKHVGGHEESCVKPQFVSYFSSLGPNESWMASSRNLVFDLLRVDPQHRWKAEKTQSELGRIFTEGVQTRQGSRVCSWKSQYPAFVEQPGLEPVYPVPERRSIQRLPTLEPPAPVTFQRDPSLSLRQGRVLSESAIELPVQRRTSRGMGTGPTLVETAGLEPVQRQESARSGYSNHGFQTTLGATSPDAVDGSPRGSLTSQVTPRTPQERLAIVVKETPMFVKLERPPNTRKSRLCPLGKSIVYVSDTLLRVYDLDFLAETRRWEREKFMHPIRTIVAADIPSSSQGFITWPGHLRNIATSIAGNFIAVLLKPIHDRQHEVRLHKFSVDQPSLQNPSTCSLLLSEPITGILHEISVSTRGSLLAHLNNELRLLPLAAGHNSPGQAQVSPRGSIESGVLTETRWITLAVAGEVQDAAFSHDGSWVYAWSRNKGFNYWYIWRAHNGQSFIRGNSPFVGAFSPRRNLKLMLRPGNRAPMACAALPPTLSFHSSLLPFSSLATIEVSLP